MSLANGGNGVPASGASRPARGSVANRGGLTLKVVQRSGAGHSRQLYLHFVGKTGADQQIDANLLAAEEAFSERAIELRELSSQHVAWWLKDWEQACQVRDTYERTVFFTVVDQIDSTLGSCPHLEAVRESVRPHLEVGFGYKASLAPAVDDRALTRGRRHLFPPCVAEVAEAAGTRGPSCRGLTRDRWQTERQWPEMFQTGSW